ncbi:DUF4007 family protein [Egicoccus halophilus]|uniref:DUF4007 domain-containing protein n=1 Tax=Egicoccus halophilus TaxID=1670830 RepID=A0A8J3AD85_9ACTN|nr:DUF4007 family protein [Egicoccus halophilus]GGI09353.1 hypothetical protein GCM10011354_33650 [Egicoccus halophilus]
MSVAIKQSLHATFGRHETFTPRYSWLKRGYDAVADPDYLTDLRARDGEYIFNDDDAHHRLGVGKNQARSIRFWLQAFRLIEEQKVPGRRAPAGEPTILGQSLLDTVSGLDPWLEDTGTWWLLHWMALSPGGYLPVWWTAFHTFPAVEFTIEQLLEHVQAQVETTSTWNQPKPAHRGTVKKDVLALLRAYAGTSGSRRRDALDDDLDAPLVPLTLIRETDEIGRFRFGVGPKPGLPAAVAAFACLDFLSRTGNTARQVLVATLASEQGGPGRALKLTERDLADLLAQAAEEAPGLIGMVNTGGSEALAVIGDESFGLVAARVLHAHYRRLGASSPEPETPYLPSAQFHLGDWT